MIEERSKELLKKAFYRGNEVADMPSYYYEGLADEWEKWYSENVENILPLYVVSNRISDEEIKRYRKEGRLSGAIKREPFYKLIAQKFDENYEDTDFDILYAC